MPFVVAAIAYYQIQSWVRDRIPLQTMNFGIGEWFDANYVANMALAIFPYDLDTTGEFIAALAGLRMWTLRLHRNCSH